MFFIDWQREDVAKQIANVERGVSALESLISNPGWEYLRDYLKREEAALLLCVSAPDLTGDKALKYLTQIALMRSLQSFPEHNIKQGQDTLQAAKDMLANAKRAQ